MKFLCLGYFDREAMAALPQAEIDALMGQCTAHMEIFHGTGQVLVDAGLDLKAKSLRRRKGKLAVTDGPFVETKEMVGGLWVIECEDLDEAKSLAKRATVACGVPVEIRPFHSI